MARPFGRPFVIGVTELLRHHGVRRQVEIDAPLPDLGLVSARVEASSSVSVRLDLEAIADGAVTATGSVTAAFVGECRRCLREVRGEVTTAIQEVFERRPTEGDTYPLDGDQVDLEPMVRDAVLLALPVAPLCDEACVGPDPEEHPVVVDSGPDEAPPADARWSALSDLRFD
jgi:uncharacterized protein